MICWLLSAACVLVAIPVEAFQTAGSSNARKLSNRARRHLDRGNAEQPLHDLNVLLRLAREAYASSLTASPAISSTGSLRSKKPIARQSAWRQTLRNNQPERLWRGRGFQPTVSPVGAG
jgi:hypothetical protein